MFRKKTVKKYSEKEEQIDREREKEENRNGYILRQRGSEETFCTCNITIFTV